MVDDDGNYDECYLNSQLLNSKSFKNVLIKFKNILKLLGTIFFLITYYSKYLLC